MTPTIHRRGGKHSFWNRVLKKPMASTNLDQEHKEECLVCEPGEYVCDKHKPQEKPVCEHMWTAVSLDLPTSVHRCMKCGVMKEWGVVKDAKPLPSQQVEELDCWLCRGMHGDMVRKLNEVIKAVNRLTSTGIKE